MTQPKTLSVSRAEARRLTAPQPSASQPRRTRSVVTPRIEAMAELARHTLIVVAPNSPRRARVVEQLRAHGYYVLTARTWLGALARASVSGRPIDLVITDPLLPGLGGLPLTRRLRRIQPALPVVLTRLCEPPSHEGVPESPAFLQRDAPALPLIEEIRALLAH